MKLPRERWAERDQDGETLLHYACLGPNVAATVALLQSGLLDVNARGKWGSTPAHYAAVYSQPRVLEVLCAAGADLRARDEYGYFPLNIALVNASNDDGETVRVLVANGVRLRTVLERFRCLITPKLEEFERGVLRCRAAVVAMLRVNRAGQLVRLSTVREDDRHLITPELEAFERGVLRCRVVVVAMLRVKQAGQLWMWNKFLLAELAVCLWSTRYDKRWQN